MTQQKTDFGFTQISLDEKQGLVNRVFHHVAGRYNLMNDLMSAGLHRIWKDAFVTALRLPLKQTQPFIILDLAGGTGDIATRFLRRGGGSLKVIVGDINAAMLAEGAALHSDKRLEWVQANAESLPFESGSLDAVTIAFGIRNVPRREVALAEIHRVLKPSGIFGCLEFSQVDVPLLDKIYDAYSFHVIPRLGELVTGDKKSYQYLVESIRRFPTLRAFEHEIRRAGFDRVEAQPLSGGIVAFHIAYKAG